MKTEQEIREEIGKGMKNGTLKFCGFVTEEYAKKLDKKKYLLLITKKDVDLIGKVFEIGNRNVYVYERSSR